MKISLRFLFVLATLLLTQSMAQAQHKVVIQLNTADTAAWSSTIGNIKNLQKVWPGTIQVEVVVHGKGLDLLVAAKTHLANEVIGLSKEGVIFSACENSMRKHNIDKSQLLKEAFTVPSGVAELVLKQEQGWSYLKASIN
jgi:intracellular sulfur oxidation DsrE/DsrF family protein